jgi:hypothetical protein
VCLCLGRGFAEAIDFSSPRHCRYRFFELTPDGIPRFPSFVGERIDMTAPKDAVLRKVTLPGAAAAAAAADEDAD